jgi:hypothetical protein
MSGEDAPRPCPENLIVPEIKTNKQTRSDLLFVEVTFGIAEALSGEDAPKTVSREFDRTSALEIEPNICTAVLVRATHTSLHCRRCSCCLLSAAVKVERFGVSSRTVTSTTARAAVIMYKDFSNSRLLVATA